MRRCNNHENPEHTPPPPAPLRYHIATDGSVTIRQGWRRVRLSHSDYLLLSQIKGWQE